MLRKMLEAVKTQKGFTLVELMIVTAISGLLVSGIAFLIMNMFTVHDQNRSGLTALSYVQSAGHFISRDAQMGTLFSTSDDPATIEATEILTISWTEYTTWKSELLDPEDPEGPRISLIIGHRVAYTLDEGILLRNEYQTPEIREDGLLDYSLYSVTQIARYITVCDYNLGSNTLTVTADIAGLEPQTETRIYAIEPRPDVT
ncbi:MAG: prepilin-type N-terminal cleavage/methylation domain-containing protein [Dehalococcoidia bacterium]|nr:MAG: prepilin-type N-terminal cleavage/methylation domain-containing protein [Dehalococcoidia bacterium]